MNILKKIIPAMGLLLPLSLSSAEYQWLTFKMTDSTEVSVAADNLSINYSGNALHLKSATVDESFYVAKIKTMRFTSLSAGKNEASAIRQESADYYNMEGVKVGRYASIEDARRELPSGVYVGKSETKTLKVIF